MVKGKKKKLREWEELFNKAGRLAFFAKKGKKKKTTEEYCEEEKEVVKPAKKIKIIIKKRALGKQVAKR